MVILIISIVTYAYARYESHARETRSVVAYGNYNGTLVAISVDADGVLQTN
jgi:hypothetical protein